MLDPSRNHSGTERILPHDPRYDDARRVWNGMIDRRPSMILRPRTTADVVASIREASANDMRIAIHGGGHSIPGYSMCDDGMVLDLRRMNGVHVDPLTRTVKAQGGCLLGDMDRATMPFSMVVPAGAVSHTGVGGLTLGGGYGHCMRRFGLTIDSLRALELVTAAGKVLRVNDSSHAELFWALRGGGGNFGVVTEFEFEAHPLPQTLYVALTLHAADRAAPMLHKWRKMALNSGDQLMWPTFLRVAPPLRWIPKDIVGKPVVLSMIEWLGEVDEGEHQVNRILREIEPDVTQAGPMPFLMLQSLIDDISAHGVMAYTKAGFFGSLSDELLDVLIEQGKRSVSWRSNIEVLPLGGAIARVADSSTAFPHRAQPWVFNVVSLWDDVAANRTNLDWARNAYKAMEPHMSGGAYVNYMGGEEPGGIRAAYGNETTFNRLQSIKAEYDPSNVFCFNQNLARQSVAST
jgi:FAD/FMN-containing dehydrogenase